MKKTFYSVQYSNWGADAPETAYFDSREAAYSFYESREYIDKPVAHSVSNPDTISKYEELVYQTMCIEAL